MVCYALAGVQRATKGRFDSTLPSFGDDAALLNNTALLLGYLFIMNINGDNVQQSAINLLELVLCAKIPTFTCEAGDRPVNEVLRLSWVYPDANMRQITGYACVLPTDRGFTGLTAAGAIPGATTTIPDVMWDGILASPARAQILQDAVAIARDIAGVVNEVIRTGAASENKLTDELIAGNVGAIVDSIATLMQNVVVFSGQVMSYATRVLGMPTAEGLNDFLYKETMPDYAAIVPMKPEVVSLDRQEKTLNSLAKALNAAANQVQQISRISSTMPSAVSSALSSALPSQPMSPADPSSLVASLAQMPLFANTRPPQQPAPAAAPAPKVVEKIVTKELTPEQIVRDDNLLKGVLSQIIALANKDGNEQIAQLTQQLGDTIYSNPAEGGEPEEGDEEEVERVGIRLRDEGPPQPAMNSSPRHSSHHSPMKLKLSQRSPRK